MVIIWYLSFSDFTSLSVAISRFVHVASTFYSHICLKIIWPVVMNYWRRQWQPTPVLLPGQSQGWGAWWATVHGVAQSQTRLKWLSSSSMNYQADAICFYSYFPPRAKAMADFFFFFLLLPLLVGRFFFSAYLSTKIFHLNLNCEVLCHAE